MEIVQEEDWDNFLNLLKQDLYKQRLLKISDTGK